MAAKRDDAEEVLTEPEAAAFLKFEPDTLRKWRGRGEGPPYSKLGASVRYLRSDLIAWLRAGRQLTA